MPIFCGFLKIYIVGGSLEKFFLSDSEKKLPIFFGKLLFIKIALLQMLALPWRILSGKFLQIFQPSLFEDIS